jgi:hypothetical protein
VAGEIDELHAVELLSLPLPLPLNLRIEQS